MKANNKIHKTITTITKYLLFLLVLLIFTTPIYQYWIHFKDLPISDNPENWGPFGDFFGGILNTFISLLTLIVTIYIGYELSKLDDRRNENTLKFERKMFLNELRENEFRRITSELHKVTYIFTKPVDSRHELIFVLMQFIQFRYSGKIKKH